MIEVFKTNVQDIQTASFVIDLINRNFNCCNANFDLQDCDRILRVKSTEEIEAEDLIALLREHAIVAEVLPDEIIMGENYKLLAMKMEKTAIEHYEISTSVQKPEISKAWCRFQPLRLN